MEAKTGVTLADRTKHGSTLTAAGTVITQWASRLLNDGGTGSAADHAAIRRA